METLTLAAVDGIERGKAGEAAAGPEPFESLMRRHERLVIGVALRLLGNMEDAKDASQEVFLRLYRNLDRAGRLDNLAGWLYRVTVNVCHDANRRRGQGGPVPVEDPAQVADTADDPQQSLTARERRTMLERGLRMLPEKERAALVLRDLEGLSTAEVAATLGSAEATVRSQIAKARIKMKGFLEGYGRRRT